MALDRYARNAAEWRLSGDIDYRALKYLFESGDPFLYLVAAPLGHLALEKYLKAILIADGMTAFDPRRLARLHPASD